MIAVLFSGCKSLPFMHPGRFQAGHRLDGRYRIVVMSENESYVFKPDGTFEHTDIPRGAVNFESGTYSIDGETVTFEVGKKVSSVEIAAADDDADKPNPAKLYIDVEKFDLVTDGR